MKNYLLSAFALLFLFSISLGQSSYFSKIYWGHPGWAIKEAHFHPKGGYTSVFYKTSNPSAQAIHRMDANGDITHSFTTANGSGGAWVRITDDGNHLVTWRLPTDSLSVTLLDSNLNTIWLKNYDLDLPNNFNGLASGLDLVDGGAIIFGSQADGLSLQNAFFLLKIDENGQEIWKKAADGLWGNQTVPYHLLELSNGNLAVTGIDATLGGPDTKLYFHMMDSVGDSLNAWYANFRMSVGRPFEHPNGELSFTGGFGWYDNYSIVFNSNVYHLDSAGNPAIVFSPIDTLTASQYIPTGPGSFVSLLEHDFAGLYLYDSQVGKIPLVLSGYGPLQIKSQLWTSHRHMDRNANGELLIGTRLFDAGIVTPLLLFVGSGGNVPTGIETGDLENEVMVYPNPNTGTFQAEWKGHDLVEGTWEMRNTIGQVVFRQEGGQSIRVEEGSLAAGVYYLQVSDNGRALGYKRLLVR